MALRISLIHWGKTFGQGHKPFLWVCRQHEDPQLQAAVTREFKDATANRVNCKCLEANPTIWSFDKGQLRQRRTVRGVSSGLPAARTRATRGFGMVGAKKNIFQMGWGTNHQLVVFLRDIFPTQKRVITCYQSPPLNVNKPFENSSVDLRRSQGRSGLSITSKGASEDCRSRLVSGSMYGLHVRMSLWKGLVIGSMVIGSLG